MRQFAEHYREKGWTRTQFQFYLNDKYFYKDPKQGGRGASWWLLDEPMHRDDWLALRFFAQMFKNAVSKPSLNPEPLRTARRDAPLRGTLNPTFLFRADVSRPQWQRDWLDGLVDVMCVSRQFFLKNDRCMAMKLTPNPSGSGRAHGIAFWHYGTGNDIRATNLTGEAWGVEVWLSGGDGFLPWNSLGGDSSFEKPTPTTILYLGKRLGMDGPLASLRLKAFRRSQQDVEYLVLLSKKMGWDRVQTAAAVAPLLHLEARTQERFTDDAGRTVFENLTGEQVARLRASVAAALMK